MKFNQNVPKTLWKHFLTSVLPFSVYFLSILRRVCLTSRSSVPRKNAQKMALTGSVMSWKCVYNPGHRAGREKEPSRGVHRNLSSVLKRPRAQICTQWKEKKNCRKRPLVIPLSATVLHTDQADMTSIFNWFNATNARMVKTPKCRGVMYKSNYIVMYKHK